MDDDDNDDDDEIDDYHKADFLEYTKVDSDIICLIIYKIDVFDDDYNDYRPWGFPGLRPGDRWCLCSRRWR